MPGRHRTPRCCTKDRPCHGPFFCTRKHPQRPEMCSGFIFRLLHAFSPHVFAACGCRALKAHGAPVRNQGASSGAGRGGTGGCAGCVVIGGIQQSREITGRTIYCVDKSGDRRPMSSNLLIGAGRRKRISAICVASTPLYWQRGLEQPARKWVPPYFPKLRA